MRFSAASDGRDQAVAGMGVEAAPEAIAERRATGQDAPSPPLAKREPLTRTFGDVTYVDPYAWLEDPRDPQVIAYLEAENAYTEAVMEPTAALRETLHRELVARVQRTDTEVPFRMGDVYYYT